LDNLPSDLTGGAVTIGNFDGVHRGHARLIERLERQAAVLGGPAIVFTFEPHPVVLLRPAAAPPPLTWAERKAELLKELGVDTVIAYPTDEPLLQLAPEEFFGQIVCQRLQARAVVEGPNFRFGRDRRGDVARLADLCRRAGIVLEIVEPVQAGESYISSSRVRECIRKGDVDSARAMLTRPYRVRGFVTHGARRGATIGFPTANLEAVDTLLPGVGVYAGRAFTTTDAWPAAINIGPNPTFSEHAFKFEIHLIGYSGSLYGQPLEVDFLSRLRDIQPFASVEQLKQQLDVDIQAAREISDACSARCARILV
jgi:riboflavin kinase/FMN adenylyltransferase